MTAPVGAPFDADRVQALVVLALGAIVTSAANFTPPIALPARQIAGAGTIPNDCEQVYAAVQTVTTGTPEPLGTSGVSTWPTQADGANQTMYSAVLQLAIVRKTNDTPTSPLGQVAPTPAAYLANLAATSADMAILMAALAQLGVAQSSATPRVETAGSPQGGMVTTSCRVTVLV